MVKHRGLGVLKFFVSETAKTIYKGLLLSSWIILEPYLLRTYNSVPKWILVTPVSIGFVVTFFYISRWWESPVYRWKVGTLAGIARVYPVCPFGSSDPARMRISEREAAEKTVQGLVDSSTQIDLLLASGWRYIGCSPHPGMLHEILNGKRSPFRLRVLLFDPTRTGDRARQQHLEPERYREGIMAVLYTLRRWKIENKIEIEVKTYTDEPIWQMVVHPEEMWLLCASGASSDTSPIYCLRRDAEYGLHQGLMGVWNRRWKFGDSVDLSTTPEPNWDKLQNLPRAGKA